MGDDIQYGNGRGPAPRRRMYAAPFGALSNDSPPIQYGDGQTGPAQGINTLASSPPPQPIAQPFGMLPTAAFTSQPPPPPTPPAPAPQPIAAPFGALQSAPMPPLQFSPAGDAASQGPLTWASINALLQSLRRRY
jgi:hypothetical protein